ncbi:hypothetical protein M0805_001956 [Coniferiporia weirii]|nr:hypothetical protein M0805_001956 [Coniferiporia weirii]
MTDSELRCDIVEMLPSLSEKIVSVTRSLPELIHLSIPVLLTTQKTESKKYVNMLTVTTFFSVVTVATLQLSYGFAKNPQAPLSIAVNALWFVALVFSTASSLNSLIGLIWCQTPELPRIRTLPDWAGLWLMVGPVISLAVASAAFSAGLCLFAFSSSQHILTSALTAAFTAAHAVALFAIVFLYCPNWLRRFLVEVFKLPQCLFPCISARDIFSSCWNPFKKSRVDRRGDPEAQTDKEVLKLGTSAESITEKGPSIASSKEPAILVSGVNSPDSDGGAGKELFERGNEGVFGEDRPYANVGSLDKLQ